LAHPSAVREATAKLIAIVKLFNLGDDCFAAMGALSYRKGLNGIPDSQESKPGLHPTSCHQCKTGLALTYDVVDATKVREMQFRLCVDHNHVL
jgi:hypothetical protein